MQLQSHFCYGFYWCSCGYGELSSFIPRLFLVKESHQTKSDHLAPTDHLAHTLLKPGKEAQIFEK